MKRTFILVLCLVGLHGLPSLAPSQELQTVTVNVTVTDKRDGKAICGEEVVMGIIGPVASCFTDGSGKCTLTASTSESVTVTVATAPLGYHETSKQVTVTPGKTHSVSLQPDPKLGTVSVTVKDEVGLVSGAVVGLSGTSRRHGSGCPVQENRTGGPTGSGGTFAFSSVAPPVGNYTISACKAGFNKGEASISSVTENTINEVAVQLVRPDPVFTVERASGTGDDIKFGQSTAFRVRKTFPGTCGEISSIVSSDQVTWWLVPPDKECSDDKAIISSTFADLDELAQGKVKPIVLGEKAKLCARPAELGEKEFRSFPTPLRIVYDLSGTVRYRDRFDREWLRATGGKLILKDEDGDKPAVPIASDGSFTVPDVFTVKPAIRIRAEIPGLRVTDQEGVHEVAADALTINTHNFDQAQVSISSTLRPVLHILKVAGRSQAAANQVAGGLGELTVVWEPEFTTFGETHYEALLRMILLTTVDAENEWEDAVIFHETGHYLHHEAFEGTAGIHEGIATFLGAVMMQRSGAYHGSTVNSALGPLSLTFYDHSGNGQQNALYQYTWKLNKEGNALQTLGGIEEGVWYILSGTSRRQDLQSLTEPCPANRLPGALGECEISVASILWDMVDGPDPSGGEQTINEECRRLWAPGQENPDPSGCLIYNDDELTTDLSSVTSAIIGSSSLTEFARKWLAGQIEAKQEAFKRILAARGVDIEPPTVDTTPSNKKPRDQSTVLTQGPGGELGFFSPLTRGAGSTPQRSR